MKNKTIIKYLIFGVIFFVAIFQRLELFSQVGKDIYAYQKGISDLFDGNNPYSWTLESFSNPDDPGNHGFAYLPGLLYVYGPLYIFSLFTNVPFQFLWKIPVLLADIGVGMLLVKILKKDFKKVLIGLIVWFFNPYFFLKTNYVYSDPLPIFFMLLSLYYSKKDSVLTGVYFTISVFIKTFPILVLPILFLTTKNKKDLILSGIVTSVFLSIPFLRSVDFFVTYLRGSLLVHGERFIQGRPFLFYISYFYKIELFQIIPFKFYSYAAFIGGWVISLISYFVFKIKNIYVVSLLAFLNFYLFTPVLNRTYLLWFIPVLIIALNELTIKKVYLYYLSLISFWFFYYYYLLDWKDGFHIWRP